MGAIQWAGNTAIYKGWLLTVYEKDGGDRSGIGWYYSIQMATPSRYQSDGAYIDSETARYCAEGVVLRHTRESRDEP